MSYTPDEIRAEAAQAMQKPQSMYKAAVFNRRGPRNRGERRYTEIAAEYLLAHHDNWKDHIPRVEREGKYRVEHTGEVPAGGNPESEKRQAIALFNERREGGFGKIIDYQVPLKGKRIDKAGEIDLLAEQGDDLVLLEFKLAKKRGEETLLRAVLEVYTYSRQINAQALLDEWGKNGTLQKAVLLQSASRAIPPEDQIIQVNLLRRELGVDVYIL